jgi:hypothetical protein
MVRVLVTVAAIGFVVGVIPAHAQGGFDCMSWCRANRCDVGGASGRSPNCMPRCTAACEAKHKSKK